jgi:hypothetical protein
MNTQKIWIDEGAINSPLEFNSRDEVVKHIKNILSEDIYMLDALGYTSAEDISEDNLFEIASNHYSIYEK